MWLTLLQTSLRQSSFLFILLLLLFCGSDFCHSIFQLTYLFFCLSYSVICWFSFAAFNICSLCLIFVSLINMCLGIFLLGFILYGTLWASWTWVAISFSMSGKFLTIISSNIFSYPYLFSSSGSPIIWMLVHLVLSQRPLRLSSFLFSLYSALLRLFLPFCLSAHIYTLLPQLFCCWFPLV